MSLPRARRVVTRGAARAAQEPDITRKGDEPVTGISTATTSSSRPIAQLTRSRVPQEDLRPLSPTGSPELQLADSEGLDAPTSSPTTVKRAGTHIRSDDASSHGSQRSRKGRIGESAPIKRGQTMDDDVRRTPSAGRLGKSCPDDSRDQGEARRSRRSYGSDREMSERERYTRKEGKQPEKARVHVAERTAGHDDGYMSVEDEAISQSVDHLVGQIADAAMEYIHYSSIEPEKGRTKSNP